MTLSTKQIAKKLRLTIGKVAGKARRLGWSPRPPFPERELLEEQWMLEQLKKEEVAPSPSAPATLPEPKSSEPEPEPASEPEGTAAPAARLEPKEAALLESEPVLDQPAVSEPARAPASEPAPPKDVRRPPRHRPTPVRRLALPIVTPELVPKPTPPKPIATEPDRFAVTVWSDSGRYMLENVTLEQYHRLWDEGRLKFQREGKPKPPHLPDR